MADSSLKSIYPKIESLLVGGGYALSNCPRLNDRCLDVKEVLFAPSFNLVDATFGTEKCDVSSAMEENSGQSKKGVGRASLDLLSPTQT